jgi:hypothetical protein
MRTLPARLIAACLPTKLQNCLPAANRCVRSSTTAFGLSPGRTARECSSLVVRATTSPPLPADRRACDDHGMASFDLIHHRRDVLALDVTSLLQTLAKCAQTFLDHRVRRSDVEEPDHWHRRLLRSCRERPCRRARQAPLLRRAGSSDRWASDILPVPIQHTTDLLVRRQP